MMKKLICILLVLISCIAFAGCAEKPKLDEEKIVQSVSLCVIDGEETVCSEAQMQEILGMYAECKNFRRNRDNAGITPPNPVEIVIRYENGQSVVIYHPGTHKIGIRDENGESWFAENEELYAYLDELQKEERRKPPLIGVTAEEVEWIGYTDECESNEYQTIYTDKEEIAQILEMFAALEPKEDGEYEEGTDYCAYLVRKNDGSEAFVYRTGETVYWSRGMDETRFRGRFEKIPQKAELQQAAIDAAEHIVYGDALSFIHHYIDYEEIERLTAERSGLHVITIPQGTELEFMPGCTMETTEEAVVLALWYEEQYHLIIPWNYKMRVEHPKGLKKTEKGPGNLVVSPNTIYTPEEDVVWPVVQDGIAEYLKVKELKIRKGAKCRLDIGFEKGKGYLWSASAALSEDDIVEARELKQSDLAVTWFDEEAVEGYLPVYSGKVVYKLSETEDTASIWGMFTNEGIETVPKEWLLPLDFEVLEQKLPAGEYVFSTYGGGCASPPNWWLGLYRKDMTDEEMRGDAPYFFTAKG